MKLIRLSLIAAVFSACAFLAPVVRAGTACPDDPERCVERGAAISHTRGVMSSAVQSHGVSTPTTPAVSVAAHKSAAATPRRPVSKPARITSLPGSATPATPGMGMLLKLSGGKRDVNRDFELKQASPK